MKLFCHARKEKYRSSIICLRTSRHLPTPSRTNTLTASEPFVVNLNGIIITIQRIGYAFSKKYVSSVEIPNLAILVIEVAVPAPPPDATGTTCTCTLAVLDASKL